MRAGKPKTEGNPNEKSDINSQTKPSEHKIYKPVGLNPKTPSFDMPIPTKTYYAGVNEATFLQVACAHICNLNDPSKKICVHILLDSGSQCSYITKGACKKLGLNSLGTKIMSILNFGSRQESPVNCDIVKVGLLTKDDSCIELKLLSIEHIYEPLINAAVDFDWHPHLKSLESNQYWSLLTQEVINGNSGPVALNSHFRWIMSGPVAVKHMSEQSTTIATHVLRVKGLSKEKCLEKELHSFWSVESLGVVESESEVQ
uniref:Uncharacterized protein n=1 Tax=Amphimedon queenslandica TaxID=400682 RepID=A0A1X7TJH0_AMPQE